MIWEQVTRGSIGKVEKLMLSIQLGHLWVSTIYFSYSIIKKWLNRRKDHNDAALISHVPHWTAGGGLGGGNGLRDWAQRETHQGHYWHRNSSPAILPVDKVSYVSPRLPFPGGRSSVLRGRVHRRQRRQRTWLADEAQWEAVAAGKNIRHFLSFGACVGHHGLPERWAGKHENRNSSNCQWKPSCKFANRLIAWRSIQSLFWVLRSSG